MSKSATEQYQIKKKRKSGLNRHQLNHHNSNNNGNNNNNCKSSDNNFKSNPSSHKSPFASYLVKAADSNYCEEGLKHFVPLLDQKQLLYGLQRCGDYLLPDAAEALDLCSYSDSSKEQCCLRDRLQVLPPFKAPVAGSSVRRRKMPLSQGYYDKGKFANKRGSSSGAGSANSLKSAKIKSNENMVRIQRNVNSNNNNNSNYFTYDSAMRKPTSLACTTATAGGGQRLQQALLKGGSSASNNLQLSYLLGESFARCGRLQEAFDMYALIVSEQLDSHIQLDRLSALASSLTAYVRQLNQQQDESATPTPASSFTNNASQPTDGYSALESSWKTKFAKHAAATNSWRTISATPNAKTYETLVEEGHLNLHAPSRELRIPSPELSEDYDPLLCPLCRDVLRCPVTTNCGHTFCRQCCETITQCNICHVKFPKFALDEFVTESTYTGGMATTATTTASIAAPLAATTFFSGGNALLARRANAYGCFGQLPATLPLVAATVTTTTVVASTTPTATTTMASTSASPKAAPLARPSDNMKFMPDVLVRRLVEKWWGADLQAKKINETAASYMHSNLLDEALKYCNASLEKSPTSFKGLLLRAEVLRKLNHFQSSLADVDNALKARFNSAKAHYFRALALNELGRVEEALYDNCLAISLDKCSNLSSSEIFQHDLAKMLQKLLAQTPKRKSWTAQSNFIYSSPYSVCAEHRWRRRQMAFLHNASSDNLSSLEEEDFEAYGKTLELMTDVDMLSVAADYIGCLEEKAAYESIAKDYEVPLRRQASRKHFRRKGITREVADLLPSLDVEEARCSVIFRNVLARTQQEVQRLKKQEASGEQTQQKHLLQVPAGLIDASDFDCVLCCRTFWKPVVTPCGHTYCWVCLDRCMDYTSSCPLCKSPLVEPNMSNMYQGSSSPVPFILAKRPVTKFLEAAMKRFIPESYEKRFRQEMDMEPSVPVFICTTAFPYVPCPLFVYEPRYRLMVRRAVESGEKQFGIVQPKSGKSRYFNVGTILDIRDCVLLGDGCSILSTIGCKRFKILARNEKDGYETAKVEYIYDESISDENVKFVSDMHASVLTKAIEWFESLSTESKQEILQSFGEMPPVEDNWESIADGPAWAWWIIALLPLSQQLKVDILATTSLEKRLRAIEKTLDYLYRRTQQHCGVVVCQQQHQQQREQQQQQQQQQQPECDNNELTQNYPNDAVECCLLRTSGVLTSSAEAHNNGGEHSQLML